MSLYQNVNNYLNSYLDDSLSNFGTNLIPYAITVGFLSLAVLVSGCKVSISKADPSPTVEPSATLEFPTEAMTEKILPTLTPTNTVIPTATSLPLEDITVGATIPASVAYKIKNGDFCLSYLYKQNSVIGEAARARYGNVDDFVTAFEDRNGTEEILIDEIYWFPGIFTWEELENWHNKIIEQDFVATK